MRARLGTGISHSFSIFPCKSINNEEFYEYQVALRILGAQDIQQRDTDGETCLARSRVNYLERQVLIHTQSFFKMPQDSCDKRDNCSLVGPRDAAMPCRDQTHRDRTMTPCACTCFDRASRSFGHGRGFPEATHMEFSVCNILLCSFIMPDFSGE